MKRMPTGGWDNGDVGEANNLGQMEFDLQEREDIDVDLVFDHLKAK